MENVSVIVPIYNGEVFVRKCVTRLLQEKDFIHEIILINDGSKDKSLEILNEYSSEEKVLIISQENRGVSATRNRGIEVCSGDWIVFCDVDDDIEGGFFEDISLLLSSNCESDLLCFARGKIGVEDKGNIVTECDIPKVIKHTLVEDTKGYLNDYFFKTVWAKVFKKEILVNEEIRFNEKLTYAEDVLFIIEYLLRIQRIDLVHRGYYWYFNNAEGTCRRGGSIKDYDGFFEFFDRIERLIGKASSFSEDESMQSTLDTYLLIFGKDMCGRVLRGARNESLKKRKKMVKDMLDQMMKYSTKASIKTKAVIYAKRYLTGIYILINKVKDK